jgi:hypothetical protein
MFGGGGWVSFESQKGVVTLQNYFLELVDYAN